jgi:phosphatidylserine synthase
VCHVPLFSNCIGIAKAMECVHHVNWQDEQPEQIFLGLPAPMYLLDLHMVCFMSLQEPVISGLSTVLVSSLLLVEDEKWDRFDLTPNNHPALLLMMLLYAPVFLDAW